MNRIAKALSIMLPALLLALPGTALAAKRLEVQAGEDWQHPHVEVIIPAKLGGLDRTGVTAFAPDFLDVGLQYDAPEGNEALSVYVFRNTNGAVPVWFEQARWGIRNRPIFAQPTLFAAPSAIVPPGGQAASALKAVYAAGPGSDFRSTGLILASIDGWYVKIRASSTIRTPAALSTWMDFAFAQISLPPTADLPAAGIIQDCETPLVFRKKAKDAPTDSGANLLGGLLGMIAGQVSEDDKGEQTESASVPTVWCRDAQLDGNRAVYRADSAADRYLLALGDNGIAALVQPDQASALLGAETKRAGQRFSITLKTADRNIGYVPQNRLPSPKRVIKLIDKNRVTVTVPTWGDKKTIEVNSDGL